MSTQRAVVHESEGVAKLKSDVPLPQLTDDNWILIKTKAVALNPTDWKSIDKSAQPGAIAGCDYAGIVEEVGKNVTNYKVGDRVAGFVRGGKQTMTHCGIVTDLDQAIHTTNRTELSLNTSKPNKA
jgi:NADPH:quinone reductase-like Zn-dependent oxidoreductase